MDVVRPRLKYDNTYTIQRILLLYHAKYITSTPLENTWPASDRLQTEVVGMEISPVLAGLFIGLVERNAVPIGGTGQHAPQYCRYIRFPGYFHRPYTLVLSGTISTVGTSLRGRVAP